MERTSDRQASGGSSPFLSVAIPVFNAERTLLPLYGRLVDAISPMAPDFEIVFVDDGSTDRSWRIIKDLAGQDSRIKAWRLSRNFGQHRAITAALDLCSGSWVAIMDCDLQDAPEEIPRLYARAMAGYDVVVARRAQRSDSWARRFASWTFYRLFSYLTDMPWDPRVGAFRLVSSRVVAEIRRMREQSRFLAGLVDWLGFPTAAVDVEHGTRGARASGYTWRALIRLGGQVVIAHTDKPLRLVIRLGLTVSALAFAAGTVIVVRSLVNGQGVGGWSSVVIAACFLSGLNFSVLGLFGVYLGKVFDEVKGRPLYVIRERAG